MSVGSRETPLKEHGLRQLAERLDAPALEQGDLPGADSGPDGQF
ncbi:hypothetical protein [Citricoccus nitrophenolicus]